MKRCLGFLLVCLMLMGFMLPTTTAQIEDPVTIRLPLQALPIDIDPARAHYSVEIDVNVNLFLSLVRNSPTEYGLIEPSLAERWEISDDGLTYTFYLRDDVPWVQYDVSTAEVIPLRMITADDVVYSVQRVCSDWRNGYYAVDVFGPIIAGCERALDGADPAGVGVEALDEHTVQFTLTAPGAYFLSMATLWTIAPIAPESIENYGEDWTAVGNLITSGPFVLIERGDQLAYIRNPYLPNAVAGNGNVERVMLIPDIDSFADFQNNDLERSSYSTTQFQNSNPNQVVSFPDAIVSYLGISNDKPPMDNVHVRRAFSAAVSRDSYINLVDNGSALPMFHFAPDILFGGLEGSAVGVGFDLEYARAQLAEAGYPNCDGLPTIEVLLWNENMVSVFADQFAQLGCTPDQLQLNASGDTRSIIDPSLFLPRRTAPPLMDGRLGT